jgi:hypothetical protein
MSGMIERSVSRRYAYAAYAREEMARFGHRLTKCFPGDRGSHVGRISPDLVFKTDREINKPACHDCAPATPAIMFADRTVAGNPQLRRASNGARARDLLGRLRRTPRGIVTSRLGIGKLDRN